MLCIKLHPLTSKMHPLKSKMHPPLNRNCTPLPGFYQNYGSLPQVHRNSDRITVDFFLKICGKSGMTAADRFDAAVTPRRIVPSYKQRLRKMSADLNGTAVQKLLT